ncbi:VOC family protein [Streptomyces sp. NPDC101237]|uniref:VOC family protein n=1 Tax=Streptomyces sp. NPDC101237 TaxID=3366139 RepID=UPI0038016580
MTNKSSRATDVAAAPIEHDTPTNSVRFAMVVLYVRDLQRSIDFYRLLGLDITDPHPERPVAAWKENGALRMIITTAPVAQRFDPNWIRPAAGGYQQVVEFFVDSDEAVDAAWKRLTSAGHKGISAPEHLLEPYATMIEDPDGNVVLITSEPAEKAPEESVAP